MAKAMMPQPASTTEPNTAAPQPVNNSNTDTEQTQVAKKKRTANPGVRVQGGRIYDSETGTTCHQCRQKTVELKAKCTDCTLYWCPRCLTNRYGEEVEEVSKLAKWPCPRCRGACNCSNCRKKRGLEATGILANVSKKAGFTSVSDLLAKNPNAKRPPALPKPADEADNIRQRTAPGVQRKPSAKVAAMELVEDCKLGERPAAMPVGSALCIHKPMGATRRARGLGWPDELGTSTPVPEGCNPGDLAEVLEFLQVFAAETGLETLQLSVVAAELLQPSTSEGRSAFGDPKASAAGQVHMQLLDLVRKDWGIKGSVGMGGWQEVMRLYLQQQAAFAPSASRLPACNAFSEDPMEVDEVEGEAPTEARSPAVAELAAGAVLVEYPAGGYWALVPELRLSMLRDLVHDALATSTLRARIEAAQDGAAAEGKGRKDELAAARKQAREAWQKQRDQEVALLITTGGAKGMTIEEQKALMEEGRLKVEAAATSAALVKVAALEASLHNTAVRGVPLGSERDGTRFWDLQCAPVLTGGARLIAQVPEGDSDAWAAHSDAQPVALALDERGRAEGPLRHQLITTYDLPITSSAAAVAAISAAARSASLRAPRSGVTAAARREAGAPAADPNGEAESKPIGDAMARPSGSRLKQASFASASKANELGPKPADADGEADSKPAAAPLAGSRLKQSTLAAAVQPAGRGSSATAPAQPKAASVQREQTAVATAAAAKPKRAPRAAAAAQQAALPNEASSAAGPAAPAAKPKRALRKAELAPAEIDDTAAAIAGPAPLEGAGPAGGPPASAAVAEKDPVQAGSGPLPVAPADAPVGGAEAAPASEAQPAKKAAGRRRPAAGKPGAADGGSKPAKRFRAAAKASLPRSPAVHAAPPAAPAQHAGQAAAAGRAGHAVRAQQDSGPAPGADKPAAQKVAQAAPGQETNGEPGKAALVVRPLNTPVPAKGRGALEAAEGCLPAGPVSNSGHTSGSQARKTSGISKRGPISAATVATAITGACAKPPAAAEAPPARNTRTRSARAAATALA